MFLPKRGLWKPALFVSLLGLLGLSDDFTSLKDMAKFYCQPIDIEENVHMSNWSNNHEVFAPQFASPETISQLKEIVAFAATHGYKIKLCGKGLSPNGCGFRLSDVEAEESQKKLSGSKEVLLNCELLHRVLDFNEETSEIHVESGITVRFVCLYIYSLFISFNAYGNTTSILLITEKFWMS